MCLVLDDLILVRLGGCYPGCGLSPGLRLRFASGDQERQCVLVLVTGPRVPLVLKQAAAEIHEICIP